MSEMLVFLCTDASNVSQNSVHFNLSPLNEGISIIGSLTEANLIVQYLSVVVVVVTAVVQG